MVDGPSDPALAENACWQLAETSPRRLLAARVIRAAKDTHLEWSMVGFGAKRAFMGPA